MHRQLLREYREWWGELASNSSLKFWKYFGILSRGEQHTLLSCDRVCQADGTRQGPLCRVSRASEHPAHFGSMRQVKISEAQHIQGAGIIKPEPPCHKNGKGKTPSQCSPNICFSEKILLPSHIHIYYFIYSKNNINILTKLIRSAMNYELVGQDSDGMTDLQ